MLFLLALLFLLPLFNSTELAAVCHSVVNAALMALVGKPPHCRPLFFPIAERYGMLCTTTMLCIDADAVGCRGMSAVGSRRAQADAGVPIEGGTGTRLIRMSADCKSPTVFSVELLPS